MKIYSLKLTNFRNHKSLAIDFEGNSLTIKGENGIGKSNILEAIHMLSTTKSLRTTYDSEVINFNENFCKIEALVENNNGKDTVELTIQRSEKLKNGSIKTAKVNKVKKPLKTFSGYFNSILFTPADIEIITGSPSIRRKYIDSVFYQFDENYKKNIISYSHVIRQRNKILELIRESNTGRTQLNYWNEKLLELGQNIQDKRKTFFNYIHEEIHNHSIKLNPIDSEYSLVYEANLVTESHMAERERAEIAAARTLIGPQRDDFIIKLNDKDLGTFGSRGQQRTAVLALKLCEMNFLVQKTQQKPVLLLDDIYSELDETHKHAVEEITDEQQTIITTATNSTSSIEYLR